jgi:peptidyl-prolyl cis-trans isomerase C
VVDERRDHAPGWLMQRDDLLHLALVTQLERAAPAPSEQEIERYVAEHPRDYQKPLRIRIFRLLVKQEDKANELLAQLGGPVDLLRFRALCRDHSIDKATHERGGDLGFVWPDGSTDVPEVSADPALYAAALPLKEGQLAPQVVKEGEHFALVWRRGSLPKETTGEAARARIAALLRERAVEQQISALLDQLKKDAVRDRADVLLGRLRRKDTRLFIEP